jgi:hypothetical protein
MAVLATVQMNQIQHKTDTFQSWVRLWLSGIVRTMAQQIHIRQICDRREPRMF